MVDFFKNYYCITFLRLSELIEMIFIKTQKLRQLNLIVVSLILIHLTQHDAYSALENIPQGLISHSGKRQPIPQEILDNPYVTGFLILDGWQYLEPQEGVYDWSHVDSELSRAQAHGKVVRLALHIGGDDVPAWIMQDYPNIKQIAFTKNGSQQWIPAYWDPGYIQLKIRFYKALGARYKDHPAIFALPVSMADPNTGDWSFRISDELEEQSHRDAAFSEQVFIDAYKRLIDAAMNAYGNKPAVTAVGPLPRELVSDQYYAVHTVLDYAYVNYPERLIVAKGALNASTPQPTIASNLNIWQTIYNYRPFVAAQFVWQVSRDSEYQMNGGVPYTGAEAPDVLKRAFEAGKSYDLIWIEPWKQDFLNPALEPTMIYGADLLTTPTTPENVTATNITDNQITLNWQASYDIVGVTGYNIYRNGSLIGNVNNSTYTDTGLAANTNYSYQIEAFDNLENMSVKSLVLNVTTAGSSGKLPLPPTNLRILLDRR